MRKYIAETMFGGPVCGASARSLAPAIISGPTRHLWIYTSAITIGAVGTIIVWKHLSKK